MPLKIVTAAAALAFLASPAMATHSVGCDWLDPYCLGPVNKAQGMALYGGTDRTFDIPDTSGGPQDPNGNGNGGPNGDTNGENGGQQGQ